MFVKKGTDFTVEADDFLFDGVSTGACIWTMSSSHCSWSSKGRRGLDLVIAGPTFGYLLKLRPVRLGKRWM